MVLKVFRAQVGLVKTLSDPPYREIGGERINSEFHV